ncbi:hypothetical protein [Curtobacterium sp. L1-20]|uniref:hypothetical protein n=1 Tax=Curtobacterium sp. L1-20 TaxID=3138181 RepID=UPI003B51D7F4
MADARSDAGRRPLFDDAFRRVLGAIRDGTLVDDRDYDLLELCERYSLHPAELDGALQRLADIGLARPLPGAVVRFTRLDPLAWAEGGWLLVGLLEVAMRATVPVATDQDLERYERLVDVARRAAAERGDELDPAVFATLAFWADRTPNLLTARLLVRTLEQVRYGLTTASPWQVTGIEPWAASSLQALRLKDPSSAEHAAHVFRRLWGHHLEQSARSWGLDPVALVHPARVPNDDADRNVPQADDVWLELLGSVRDGTLQRGQEYTIRGLAARLRVPVQRLLPMVRRLETMGLVRAGDDRNGSILVATTTVTDWAETIGLLLGLQEMCMRATVPALSEDDRDGFDSLVRRIRWQARTRDHAYTSSLLELNRFFAERCPDQTLRRTTTIMISRLAYVLPEAPAFRQWDTDDFLQLLSDAVRTGDADAASEACHALAVHFDAHVDDVTARYGTMGP